MTESAIATAAGGLDPAVRARIGAHLDRIEAAHGVRVLYACESGSRAWGFPSADSDYDARFVYAHAPDWYFSVFEQRDVIELPIEGLDDANGWDLRKALRLLARSNPVLIEWLQSPLRYRAVDGFHAEFLALAGRLYSPVTGHWHYHSMARRNHREHLQGDAVKLKKYLYVLRPLLACRWIGAGLGLPPMEFMALVDAVVPAGELRRDIEALRARKMAGEELGAAPRIASIHAFVETELKRLGAAAPPQGREAVDCAALDDFLRRWTRPPES